MIATTATTSYLAPPAAGSVHSGVIVPDLVGAVGLASILTVLFARFKLLSVFAYGSSVFCYNLPVTFKGNARCAVHGYAMDLETSES